MRIYSETNLENFKAWSGAVDTLDRVREAGRGFYYENQRS